MGRNPESKMLTKGKQLLTMGSEAFFTKPQFAFGSIRAGPDPAFPVILIVPLLPKMTGN